MRMGERESRESRKPGKRERERLTRGGWMRKELLSGGIVGDDRAEQSKKGGTRCIRC